MSGSIVMTGSMPASVARDGFKIQRRVTGSGAYADLISLSGNAVTYADTSVAVGTAYDYQIAPFNAGGVGPYVEHLNTLATIPPPNIGVTILNTAVMVAQERSLCVSGSRSCSLSRVSAPGSSDPGSSIRGPVSDRIRF